MYDLKLSFRNILRNTRRSVVTVLAIALSCAGLTLFAGYVSWTYRSVESQTVCSYSHIQIFKKGFYVEGGGNPSEFAIGGYDRLKKMLYQDPVIGPRLELVTAQILFNGLVSYYRKGSSSTFFGLGVFPEDHRQLTTWNPYHIFDPALLKQNRNFFASIPELDPSDLEGGSMGVGLAKILKLDFVDTPEQAAHSEKQRSTHRENESSIRGIDLDALLEEGNQRKLPGERPSVELLSSSPVGGGPNVTTVYIRRTFTTGTKEFDDQLIKLNIRQASQLLFPGQELKATAILLLLKRTADVPIVAARLAQLISEKNLDLEFKTWTQLRPFYTQLTKMFNMMFIFMFCIIAVIVIFTIYNTLATTILERMNEIGTLRVMGMTKAAVRRSFVSEGVLLGVMGGILGVFLALVVDLLISFLEIVYIPPGMSFYAKLEVLVLRNPATIIFGLLTALLSAFISSILSAGKASRMLIVEALRHS